MADSQPIQSIQEPKPKHPTGNNRGLSQAYDIRDFAATELLALRETETQSLEDRLARAQAVRCMAVVWKDACDRIRILRGRPLPGSLRPEKRKPKPKVESTLPEES